MGRRTRGVVLYGCAAALLGAITWLDYVTGYELGFFVFYFIPVSLAAWYGSRAAGLAYAIASGICWYASDRLSLHPYSNALLIYWETFMHTVSFLVIALALSHIRAGLRQRQDVLHVVSHDLRAPLAALVGHASILARRAQRDEFTAARADAILRCAARIEGMIQDLVDSARSESHQLRLRLAPVDVRAHLCELLRRSASLVDVERVRVSVAPGGPLLAQADPDRLDRIVLNLLSNALKYSPPDSLVEVGAARTGGGVTISVADHGEGIPKEDLPHVFDRFYRGQRTAAQGGLGIGLYSVRLLVEAHGGTVRAEPGRQGGTTFHVFLPGLRAASGHAPRVAG